MPQVGGRNLAKQLRTSHLHPSLHVIHAASSSVGLLSFCFTFHFFFFTLDLLILLFSTACFFLCLYPDRLSYKTRTTTKGPVVSSRLENQGPDKQTLGRAALLLNYKIERFPMAPGASRPATGFDSRSSRDTRRLP